VSDPDADGEGPHGSDGRVRVGIDLAAVAEVADSIARYGDRYLRRIFTPAEVADCAGAPDVRAARLAARFAAKEAVLKVLRPTVDVPAWTEIEVRRTPDGWCRLELHGSAARIATEAGLDGWSVSLTHETAVAAAVAMAIVRAGAATGCGGSDGW
jgi:holo-[acyl-carrier protein] synthase